MIQHSYRRRVFTMPICYGISRCDSDTFHQVPSDSIHGKLLIDHVSVNFLYSAKFPLLLTYGIAMLTSELPRLFDSSPNGILLVDEAGRVTSANRRACELFHLDPELSVETVWFPEFLEPDDAQLIREHLAEMVTISEHTDAESSARMVEVRVRTGRETVLWFEVAMNLDIGEGDSRSNSASIMLILTDITRHKQHVTDLKQQNEKLVRDMAKLSRKRREDARQAQLNYHLAGEQIELARAEKKIADDLAVRWSSLTEHAPQIVMLLNRKGKVLFCNRMSPDEDSREKSPKKSVEDFIPARDPYQTRRVIEEVLREQHNKAYDVEGLDANGNPVWHSISVGPIAAKKGERSESVVLIATDISQRKLAEQSVVKHQEELAHVSRLATMGALTAELAHELNQPLGVIGIFVGGCIIRLERPDWKPEEIIAAQNKIQNAAHRAGQITRRILDFLQRRDSPRMLTDLRWLLNETLPFADLEAQKHQVPLTTDIPYSLPEVKVNRVQIQQILINLISNAVQSVVSAAPDSPEVTVSMQLLEHEGVAVSVTDNGFGFAPDLAEKLFEPLFTTKDKGTGMGLSICRRLVELHGGTISATGAPGAGATFTFIIPLYDPAREAQEMRSNRRPPEPPPQ